MAATTPLITGTDFVLLPTQDFERACAFYGDTLGLVRGARYGRHPGAEFETGNLTLAVMQMDHFGMEFRTGTGAIALRVEDIQAAKAELESRGVVFTGGVDTGVCHQAYFKDPDGNQLVLHQRYAPRD